MRLARSSIFEYGELGNYCTIAGYAARMIIRHTDGADPRSPGGYLWKGRMQLGSVSNAVSL